MNILTIANGIYPETIGGIEVGVAKLSQMQTNEGHNVTVILPKPASSDGSTPDFCSIQHYDPKFRLFGNPLSPYPYTHLKKHHEDYDVVHSHSHLFSGSVFAARVCEKLDIPYVVTSHGFESQTAPMYVNKVYNNSIGKYVFEAADAIITYTSTEVQKIQDLGIKRDKIHLVTRGIDIDSFSPQFNKPKDPAQLLWVSRFVPGKGASVVVQTVYDLQQNGVNVEATLVGTGPQREEVEKLIHRLGISSSITIKESLSEAELQEEYRQATLFLLPSVSEGMNRTILESMASGTPVVISDLPHFREIVHDCGKIVPKIDSKYFAEAVEEMLNTDLNKPAKTARRQVEGQFTWDQTFNDIRPIFQEITST